MKSNKSFLLLILLLLTGCQQVVQKNHILTVNEYGEAYDPGTCNSIGMNCDPLPESLECHLDTLLDTPNTEGCKISKYLEKKGNQKTNQLVIYIHGGLNTPSAQIDKANELIPIIEATGFKPIFIDWRSGLITSYRDHLLFERQGEFWPFAGPLTSPFVLLADLGRGVTRLPIDLWEAVSNFNKAHILGSEHTPSEANAAKITGFPETSEARYAGFGELPKPLNEQSMGEATGFDIAADLAQTTVSLSTLPLFDAIGSGAWATMKRRTETLFTRDKPHYSLASNVLGGDGNFKKYKNIDEYKKLREGVVSKFFNKLEQAQKDNPKLEITLVGHSMGAIVANKALGQFPKIRYSKIIYMAAACSIEDYRLSVLPYLRENEKTQFYNYTLHPIAENTEAHLFGLGGTGSLLAQIDNMYEAPTTEDQRTLGRWSNTMNGINYLADVDENELVKKRLYFRTMPLGCGYPQKHGDFDNSEFIRPSNRFWEGMLGGKSDIVVCK